MRMLVVGDTHGNHKWLERVVYPTAIENQADVIFQIGDFGWWPSRNTDLGRDPEHSFVAAARRSPLPLYWIDGNHEDHDALDHLVRTTEQSGDGTYSCGGELHYVPRGTVFDFAGVRVFACGGAHSIDKARRTTGVSWFPQEDLTHEQVEHCLSLGTADLMITHDCPAGWKVPNIMEDEGLPMAWYAELPWCKSNQLKLHKIMESVQPRMLIHGHFHSYYGKMIETLWGRDMLAVGLDCDPSRPSDMNGSDKSLYSTMLLELSPGSIVIQPLVGDEVSHPFPVLL